VSTAEILCQLEAGEAPHRVASSLGLDATDLIAVLAHAALGPGEDDGPPLVQSEPRRPALGKALSPDALEGLLPGSARPARLALAAGLLQIHDFWDASHEAAQQADDLGERLSSAYWHGIAHRREPDAGNAGYWFRRVGRHSIFRPLWESALPMVEAGGDAALAARLASAGTWDPHAMTELCTSARAGTPREALALRLQQLEMIRLLDATAATILA
jgi:hypothetical protein